jgi:hypothetical protein
MSLERALLVDWMMKLAMHDTGRQTPYASLKPYQEYETASVSPVLTQDVLVLAGDRRPPETVDRSPE